MFKKMKIAQKLIISFVIVAIISSISGIVCVAVTKNINTRYDEALTDFGFIQGDVGQLMAIVGNINGNVHDAISYFEPSDKEKCRQNVADEYAKVDAYFTKIDKTMHSQNAKDELAAAKSVIAEYMNVANELMEEGQTTDPTAVRALQAQLDEKLEPLYNQINESLTVVMVSKVSTGNETKSDADHFSNIALIVAIILIALSIFLSVFLGTKISKGISKPITLCSDRLRLLSQGILSAPVPEIDAKDETGELAESTKIIVEGLSAVLGDVDYLLDSMAEGDFDIRS